MELPVGTLLGGRYRVLELLDSGGMGSIYACVQVELERRVALKVLHPHLVEQGDLLERFRREARAIAALRHPNVVQVSDVRIEPGEPPFIVMELLAGEPLSSLLKRSRQLPGARVAFIAVQALSALAAAHRAGIIHRDIKPDNLFLSSTSVQADLVKILDFGVAKMLRDEKDPKITHSGHFVGTLAYTSPEQARGESLDGRADLYSLGACMYVALAGRKPFDAPTTAALVAQIFHERPASLAAIRTDLPSELCAIVDRALAKRPEDRFANAEEMAAALAPFAETSVVSPRTSGLVLPTPLPSAPTVRDLPHAAPGTPLPVASRPPAHANSLATEPLPLSLPPVETPIVLPPPSSRQAPRSARASHTRSALAFAGILLFVCLAALLAARVARTSVSESLGAPVAPARR